MALAAKGGGTKIIDAFAPVSFMASSTELNTGTPSVSVPPLLGVTPPTTLVPYSIDCWVWNAPCLPVIPWQINLVSLLIHTLAVTGAASLWACLTKTRPNVFLIACLESCVCVCVCVCWFVVGCLLEERLMNDRERITIEFSRFFDGIDEIYGGDL